MVGALSSVERRHRVLASPAEPAGAHSGVIHVTGSPIARTAGSPPRAPARPTAVVHRSAAEVEELPPLPEEVVLHRRLKSTFIDLDALVASLRADRLTGYLRAQARGFEGVLLFARGERGLSCYRGDTVVTGPRAGELVRRRAAGDDVLIDVVRVRAVTAQMLPQLFLGPSQHVGFSRFVVVEELLAQLVEERTDAAVVVAGRRDCGVAMVRGGRIDSAWTRLHPRPQTSLEAVLVAGREPTARVEVVVAPAG